MDGPPHDIPPPWPLLSQPLLTPDRVLLGAEGRDLVTEDGAPVLLNLEELADLGTPEGVEEIHNVLGR